VAQGFTLGPELGPGTGFGVQLVQIRHVLRQGLKPGFPGLLAAPAGLQGAFGAAQRLGFRSQVGLQSQHFIQQAQVPFLGHEALVIVLAGESHPESSRFPQVPQGAGGPVDPGPAAPRSADLAAEDHGLLPGEPPGLQEQGPGLETAFDHAFNHGPVRSGSDQFAVPASPHQQGQGIHQQGFAGPRFPGEHGEPSLQGEGQVLHQGQVLDAKRFEHGPSVARHAELEQRPDSPIRRGLEFRPCSPRKPGPVPFGPTSSGG